MRLSYRRRSSAIGLRVFIQFGEPQAHVTMGTVQHPIKEYRNEMGRFVKRGEKGIQILAPIVGYRPNRKDAAAEPAPKTKPQPVPIGFRAVYVFDVAQTEGADLPEFAHSITGEVGEHRYRLIDFLAQQKIML
jgi:hypothetical protein